MLILHYHIFKNAGTSLDVMLQKNFGDGWVEAEFPVDNRTGASNSGRVAEWLAERPQIIALSSHTAQMPLPALSRPVFPILFVRHPLDRLKSAYDFERVQKADTHGAQLAKQEDFAGYVRRLLADRRFRQARDFQTLRFAGFEPPERGDEAARALRALDALPFVGLVEAYDRSLARLAELLAPHHPNFRIAALHENRTAGRKASLEERLAALRSEVPADLYRELEDSNSGDFRLYEAVRARYC